MVVRDGDILLESGYINFENMYGCTCVTYSYGVVFVI